MSLSSWKKSPFLVCKPFTDSFIDTIVWSHHNSISFLHLQKHIYVLLTILITSSIYGVCQPYAVFLWNVTHFTDKGTEV